MSLLSIRQALEAHLSAMGPIYTALPTIFENTGATPPKGAAYQKAFLLPAEPENPCTGSDFFREQGILQVSLYYPRQATAKPALERAEQTRLHFQPPRTLTSGGVEVIISRTPEIQRATIEEERYHVPVLIRWFANIL